jgi:hypothetical protein
MNRRLVALSILTPMLFVLSSAYLSHTRGAIAPAKPASMNHDDSQLAQVRAEYIDLNGNRDETKTTLVLVNRSMSKTLVLGTVMALGSNGLSEMLAIDGDLDGVTIPPLGSLDVPVDSAHFPGLQPKLEDGQRGLESVAVSWSGGKDALRLMAVIRLQLPGATDTRVANYVEGHSVEK